MWDINWRENERIKDIPQNVYTNIFCPWNNNYIGSFVGFFYLSQNIFGNEKRKDSVSYTHLTLPTICSV